jgi:hypothetical protein
MNSMAKRKATITVLQENLDEARRLSGITSVSGVIEEALDRFIRTERLASDVRAYSAIAPTSEEAAHATTSPPWDDLADDTDWEAVYADLL